MVFRWRTRSDHVTRNALAARNNEAYGQGNGRQSFRTVLRIIKNTGHGNFVIGVFTLKLQKDYLSETSLCTVAPSPTDTPPIFRGVGGGCTQAIWNRANKGARFTAQLLSALIWNG